MSQEGSGHHADFSFAGILHTIFFHRYFPSIRPRTRDILDLTLPVVEDVELETLIEQRTSTLVQQLDTNSDMRARSTGVRGTMAVQFFEKKRRKAWFTKAEEEVCWEQWTLNVTLATPKTETGMLLLWHHHEGLAYKCFYRESEGSKGYGGHVAESCNEDCDDGKQRERPYPTYYDQRSKPVPLPDSSKSKGGRLVNTNGDILNIAWP